MSQSRIVGVDSLSPVSDQLIANATTAIGETPKFWGRYFTSVSTTGTGEYRHRNEDPVLSRYQIRVLPIARQTNHVGSTNAQGLLDGSANAKDLLATFGDDYLLSLGGKFRIFLDVEGTSPKPPNNPGSRLATEYYLGWVKGLADASPNVQIMPCVYGIPGDAHTWKALSNAVSQGAACYGVWLSHPYNTKLEPVAWSAPMLAPYQDIPGVPVLLWQYLFGDMFDRDMVNPNLGDASEFLETLILPPAT